MNSLQQFKVYVTQIRNFKLNKLLGKDQNKFLTLKKLIYFTIKLNQEVYLPIFNFRHQIRIIRGLLFPFIFKCFSWEARFDNKTLWNKGSKWLRLLRCITLCKRLMEICYSGRSISLFCQRWKPFIFKSKRWNLGINNGKSLRKIIWLLSKHRIRNNR